MSSLFPMGLIVKLHQLNKVSVLKVASYFKKYEEKRQCTYVPILELRLKRLCRSIYHVTCCVKMLWWI